MEGVESAFPNCSSLPSQNSSDLCIAVELKNTTGMTDNAVLFFLMHIFLCVTVFRAMEHLQLRGRRRYTGCSWPQTSGKLP